MPNTTTRYNLPGRMPGEAFPSMHFSPQAPNSAVEALKLRRRYLKNLAFQDIMPYLLYFK